jgi:hypothetical protein
MIYEWYAEPHQPTHQAGELVRKAALSKLAVIDLEAGRSPVRLRIAKLYGTV